MHNCVDERPEAGLLPVEWPAWLEDAVRDLGPEQRDELLGAASEYQQGAWTLFIERPCASDALVVWDDLGALTMALARVFTRVTALCPEIGTARLVGKRAAEAGLDNVNVAVSSEKVLPFMDGSFDCVVMHRVTDSENWRDMASDGAPEPLRVLKQGGAACISGDMFKSRSLKSLKRGLLGTGLSVHKEFHFLDGIGRAYLVRAHPGRWEIGLESLKRAKQTLTCGDRGFLLRDAARDGGRLSPLDEIVAAIGESAGQRVRPEASVQIGSASVIVKTAEFIIKIAGDRASEARCANNFETLSRIKGFDATLPSPSPVLKGRVSGYSFFVETRLGGREINHARRDSARNRSMAREALEGYILVQRRRHETGGFDDEAYALHVESWLTRLADSYPEVKREVSTLKEIFHARLAGCDIPLGDMHGDFKYSNFLFEKGRVSGLIDWDLSVSRGLYQLDAVLFRAVEHGGRDVLRSFKTVAMDSSGPLKNDFIKMGVDPSLSGIFGFTALAYYLNRHLNPLMRHNADWRSACARDVIGPFAAQLLFRHRRRAL